jgi:hypothetical protein
MLVAGRCVVVVTVLPALGASAAVISRFLAALVGAAGHFVTFAALAATTASCGSLAVLGARPSISAGAARRRFFRLFT